MTALPKASPLSGLPDSDPLAMCSQCGVEPAKTGQRYCKTCHAAYMRFWRRHGREGEDQQPRQRARAQAGSAQRRGVLVQEPCAECGSPDSEKHHPDYEQPLLVIWLCRPCHLRFHMKQFHARGPQLPGKTTGTYVRVPYWTVRRSQLLRELWGVTALPTVQIARRLGRSLEAVVGKAERMGLPRRPSERRLKRGGK